MRRFSFTKVFVVIPLYLLLIALLSACDAQGQNAQCSNSPNCNIVQSQSGSSSNGQSNTTSSSSQTSQQGSGNTTSSNPPPPTGTVLYQEDGSDGWQGWALSPDWKTVENNTLLINDGSHVNNFLGPTAIAPYTIPNSVQNFAIETTITSPQPQGDTHFSITSCGSTADSGWQGYEALFAYVYTGSHEVQIFANRDRLATANFDPGTNQHNYRIEVKGNVITVFIDHAQVAQATDNKFITCGRQVGLLSSLVVLRVSSFKVIVL